MEQKIVNARWAIIKQASEMPGIKIKKIMSNFLNRHFSDLLDGKDKAQPSTFSSVSNTQSRSSSIVITSPIDDHH
jgi:hypothetical protein